MYFGIVSNFGLVKKRSFIKYCSSTGSWYCHFQLSKSERGRCFELVLQGSKEDSPKGHYCLTSGSTYCKQGCLHTAVLDQLSAQREATNSIWHYYYSTKVISAEDEDSLADMSKRTGTCDIIIWALRWCQLHANIVIQPFFFTLKSIFVDQYFTQ